MKLYNMWRAFWSGQRMYLIPDLNRRVFAPSLEQCEKKFYRHRVIKMSYSEIMLAVIKQLQRELKKGNHRNYHLQNSY